MTIRMRMYKKGMHLRGCCRVGSQDGLPYFTDLLELFFFCVFCVFCGFYYVYFSKPAVRCMLHTHKLTASNRYGNLILVRVYF